MFETGKVRAIECYSLRQVRRYNRDNPFEFPLHECMVCVLIGANIMSTHNIPLSI